MLNIENKSIDSPDTKDSMKFHLVIIENESTVTNNLPSHSVYKVADCFVNPLLKDITIALKELCYGRPSNIQKVLNKAIEEIDKLDNQSF